MTNGYIQSSFCAMMAGDTDLPVLLQAVGIAFLTILIAIAIALFSDRRREFEILDNNVLLDHVVQARRLLLYFAIIFIPFVFWNASGFLLRSFELILWMVGIYFVVTTLTNSYHWMKGNRFGLRSGYLKNLKNEQDMEDSWRSVWEAEKINPQNEKEFFSLFSERTDTLIENGDKSKLRFASKLLSDFGSFIDKRSTTFLVWPEGIFGKVLQGHFDGWRKEYEYLGKDEKLEEWSSYSEITRSLDYIIREIEVRALRDRASFPFFGSLKKHIDRCQKEKIGPHSYADSLFRNFYSVFFDKIWDSPERYDIWHHYFPEEWKVTKENLLDKGNLIADQSLQNFFEWSQNRIYQPKEDLDTSLNDVSSNIFPETDPIVWSKLLIFLHSYHEGDMKSVIGRPWNFGYMGRVRTYGGRSGGDEEAVSEMRKENEKEISNTFELAFFLFGKLFSEDNLKKYIALLEKLQYHEDSGEERKRRQLLSIFKRMLSYLIEQSPSGDI